MEETEQIGRYLKAKREQHDLTLKQVADISGLSIGFISQVERGLTDPSLASLKKLVSALGMNLSDLFVQSAEVVHVVRKGHGSKLALSSSVICELLAPSFTKQMEPVLKHIMPNSESGILDPHTGEEFVWIISGMLEIVVGQEVYSLSAGDSIYFQSSVNHGWKNSLDKTCEALWIVTPPNLN